MFLECWSEFTWLFQLFDLFYKMKYVYSVKNAYDVLRYY